MKSFFLFAALAIFGFSKSQNIKIDTLLTDNISIRAIEVYDGKVWYSGTDSKFGFVNINDTLDKKQIRLSDKNLQFRTLAQDKEGFYTINVESPANFYKIDKKSLKAEILLKDSAKTAFYDALHFTSEGKAYAFSDPDESLKLKLAIKYGFRVWHIPDYTVTLNKGEAAFAASNTNIASSKNYLWIATGGLSSRIIRQNLKTQNWEIFNTPIVQGTSSQGIYSIDFADDDFGIAVGGDYKNQSENINNIATTNDGGKTWQIQASGQNAGYSTCVKIKPKSKGKEIIALGDGHISYSKDFGKTWTKISDAKDFYTCAWLDAKTLVLAGKNKIAKLSFLD